MEIHQERPGEQSWQLWRKAMILWTKTMKLEKSLGKWCKTGEELDQKSIPVKATTQDGTVTWECSGYSGQ
eukprot:3322905-Ditylum_brightwellii.AAC.1